ncbi:MAG: hypothetical protein CL755_12670 [Chloroflexi bacterium]|nr:hypothetical protein [Chloroflexota bacterium]|tara:strand:- start:2795 stop:3982 length:1188 start_codon:yes stop_codon:yes gene_type:complete
MKLHLPLTGIAIGIVISIVGVMASAPPCAFADESCPEGATSTFTGTVGVKGGTAYTTTLTSALNTADQTITLPDATGTLMSSSSVDNVTNKTIDFTSNTGANYNSGDLGGSQLKATVLSSSLDTVGILSGMDIGSDLTTLEEAIAGDINIEGETVYRAGGADVPPSQGGTGTSSITANSAVIGNGVSGVLAVDMADKGDLLVGKTGGVPDKIAVGTPGDKLTADSTANKGMTWTTPTGGSGLAVIDGHYYNDTTSWSSSWTVITGQYAHWPASFGFTTTGSTVNESGGVFTFPETGIYEIQATMCNGEGGSTTSLGLKIELTQNSGGSWFAVGRDNGEHYNMGGSPIYCGRVMTIVDIDNISSHWIRFNFMCGSCASFSPAENESSFFFIKLADS